MARGGGELAPTGVSWVLLYALRTRELPQGTRRAEKNERRAARWDVARASGRARGRP